MRFVFQKRSFGSTHGSVPGHGCITMKRRILYCFGICVRAVFEGKWKQRCNSKRRWSFASIYNDNNILWNTRMLVNCCPVYMHVKWRKTCDHLALCGEWSRTMTQEVEDVQPNAWFLMCISTCITNDQIQF